MRICRRCQHMMEFVHNRPHFNLFHTGIVSSETGFIPKNRAWPAGQYFGGYFYDVCRALSVAQKPCILMGASPDG